MAEMNLTIAIQQLLEKKHLLSANEILKYFQVEGRSYNKTSVYRALDQLYANNIICRHHFSEDEAKYELRDHHHTHLVCTHCGKIDTADCTYIEPDTVHGFQPDHHHTTVFGLCKECQ